MTSEPHPRHVAAPAEAILDEVERAVVGKRDVLELVLLALLADGHVLLEDVPGVAKTLIARSFAAAIGLRFGRVQFTPDLLPSDVTGSSVFDQRTASFEFRPGPVFCNLLLGDEINRAPPKTQAALLEAMEERQVTADDGTHALARPFLVLATQNPIEYEGTYPLPEAQLDRFLVRLRVGYPTADDEWGMLDARARRGTDAVALNAIIDGRGPAQPPGRRRGRARGRRGRALHGRPGDGDAGEPGGRGRREPARLAGAAAPVACAGGAGGARLRRARRRQGRRRPGAGPPARAAPGAVGAPGRRRRRRRAGARRRARPARDGAQDDERQRVTDPR